MVDNRIIERLFSYLSWCWFNVALVAPRFKGKTPWQLPATRLGVNWKRLRAPEKGQATKGHTMLKNDAVK